MSELATSLYEVRMVQCRSVNDYPHLLHEQVLHAALNNLRVLLHALDNAEQHQHLAYHLVMPMPPPLCHCSVLYWCVAVREYLRNACGME